MTDVLPVNRAVTLAAEMAVLRAMEAAGKRARLNRTQMGEVRDVPSHLVHTAVRLAGTPAECDRLLGGVWLHLQLVVPDQPKLVEALDWYARELIVARRAPSRDELLRVLAVAYE